MRISFNDLLIAKIIIPKQSSVCEYIINQFLLLSLPLIFKNKDFKKLFIEESINSAIKEDSEISKKLIKNLEEILVNNNENLRNIFESISIDDLEEKLENEINQLSDEFSKLLSSKYASLSDIFSTIKFGSILMPKKELALEVREKIINHEICFNDAIEKYSIGVEGKSKGIIGPVLFNDLPNWLISILRKTDVNFPSQILPLEVGFMIVQPFEIVYPDLKNAKELNRIYRMLIETTINEISKKIEFGVIGTKMNLCVKESLAL